MNHRWATNATGAGTSLKGMGHWLSKVLQTPEVDFGPVQPHSTPLRGTTSPTSSPLLLSETQKKLGNGRKWYIKKRVFEGFQGVLGSHQTLIFFSKLCSAGDFLAIVPFGTAQPAQPPEGISKAARILTQAQQPPGALKWMHALN